MFSRILGVVGILLIMLFAVPASADAFVQAEIQSIHYTSQQYDWPAECSVPCTLTATAKPDPGGQPTTKQWSCDANTQPLQAGGNSFSCTYSQAGSSYLQLVVTDPSDGQVSGTGHRVTVTSTPAEQPGPAPTVVGGDRRSLALPTTLQVRTAKPNLGLFARNSGDSGDSAQLTTPTRSGPDGSGAYTWTFTVYSAPVGPLEIEASTWAVNGTQADQATFRFTVSSSPPPCAAPNVVQGTQCVPPSVVPYERFRSQMGRHKRGSTCVQSTTLTGTARQSFRLYYRLEVQTRKRGSRTWKRLSRTTLGPRTLRPDRSGRVRLVRELALSRRALERLIGSRAAVRVVVSGYAEGIVNGRNRRFFRVDETRRFSRRQLQNCA